MKQKIVTAVALLLLTLPLAASMPVSKAEDVGLSTDRLKRINQLIDRAIAARDISGGVTIVARRGKIAHFEAQGLMDIEANTPMRKDAIFRIASMTKPVTGVAIMMLVEEGKVRLSDPVSRFIPEFKDTTVALASGKVPAARAITVRDLLTHTSGLGSGGLGTKEGAKTAPRRSTDNLATYIPTLGAVSLDFQPGTLWRYSALAGIEVLGRIVEVASGATFDRFLQDRIFAPLGMKDTTFVPTPDRLARAVHIYERTPEGTLRREETPPWLATKTLFSGGGGLWSTAEDYLQFAQMLLNGGQLNEVRLLGPRTVALMASNHVGDLYTGTTGTAQGTGFGLTVDVMLDNVTAGARKSNGSYGWGGAFGTYFWVDPKEQLTAIMMIQTPANYLRRDFENAVMQAVIE
jgi:CubicO group peptidase (beta-lactamase class C family)